ncbi:MAG: AAA family ATPase [Thermodesulfobacteriota bacterium]|nr:AAA family ATPase [Thermodesulfobacteriota bacterium]
MTPTPYQGMRWFKCDLHVHTPEDSRHWNDPSLRISSPRDEKDLQAKARSFLEKCHDCGLECIAVVDHNFSAETNPRLWFLTHLIEQNSTVADSKNRPPIVIFPGFELDIRYHILCLFEPVRNGARLQSLSDTLTNMGLQSSGRFSNGIPQQPKHHGQCWSLREVLDKVQNDLGGIVIAAHAFSNDGICNDTANISDFVENWDLYAVEVNAWPPGQKARSILEGSNNHWKRAKPHRQPAALCGSDCKSLEDPSCANNLGCRFSWIKMSSPSIESLRQAFLDPESRICLDPEPPLVEHTHIQRIEINGTKFLKDQIVALSPHLNCLIGGRGSGKSMVFESMRLGIRGETAFRDVSEKEHVAARQVKRLRGTFTDHTAIRLCVFHHDSKDEFLVDNSGAPSQVVSRDVTDAATVFRRLDALIFSQEEITQLADRQKSLLDFIDNLTRERLESHQNRAREIVEKLKMGLQVDKKIRRLDDELTTLKQEADELGRQLAAKTTVQAELKKHRAAQEAERYLEKIASKAEDTKERLETLAEELETEPPPLGSRVEGFPHPDFFKDAEEKIAAAYQQLAETLRKSAETLVKSVSEATSRHADWPDVQQAIEKAEKDFHGACSAKGLTVEEAEKLRETEQQHRVKTAALQAKQAERDQAAKQRPDKKKLLEELTQCWLSEAQARQDVLNAITTSATMPQTDKGEAIVKTSLEFSGDRQDFLTKWGELSPPRNTKAGRLWDRYARDGSEGNIGDSVFDVFLEHRKVRSRETEGQNQEGPPQGPIAGNPIQYLEMHWDNDQAWPPMAREYRDEIARVRDEKRDKWFELMLTRIRDTADLILLRSDGSQAGSFQKGDLSTGQKNTAVLSLLLAQGTGPVLIDQPEDELDSEFLYKELVPLFRSAKQKRQLIIVTHNANIPVNADAELVYALKAEGGRGVCLSQGGLDRPEVTRAVLDIMEGSEEAFRRRQEKYHF